MMQVTIDLSAEQAEKLRRAFPGEHISEEETAVRLVELATAAWVDWLSGEKRYTSMTQQYADWVEAIYVELLPGDERPSTERLYNYFNMPYGQAQYVARVLNNKSLAVWRRQAHDQLKEMMAKRLAEVEHWLADGGSDPHTTVELVMDKLAYLELKAACERIFQQDPDGFIPPTVRVTGLLHTVSIAASCFRQVHDAL